MLLDGVCDEIVLIAGWHNLIWVDEHSATYTWADYYLVGTKFDM